MDTNAPEQKAPAIGMWAIIEIFGHQRIAGYMTEQVIGGQGFIRVDVPAIEGSDDVGVQAHTKFYGPGAVYAINPVDEPIARLAARQIRHAPVSEYGLRGVLRNMPEEHRQRLLTADMDGDDDTDRPF